MNEKENNNERKIVIPGETIATGEDYLPGDFTRKEGNEIIANKYGLAENNGRIVKVIPISGIFEPRKGNSILGRIQDITFNGWIVDVSGPYSAFLPLSEVPRFLNKNNMQEFANIGDIINAKILNVSRNSIDLTLKARGLGKLEGGRIIRINPHKVPRVIGREGSMINLIKDDTKTQITVGQNGYIWIRGEDIEGERKAEEAIKLVCREAASSGLTEAINEFLQGDKK